MSIVEGECGIGDVETIDTYREMFLPLMRERCPADAKNAIGCTSFLYLTGLLLLLSVLSLLFITLWAAVITIKYYSMQREMLSGRGQPLKNSPSMESVKKKKNKSQAFTKPSPLKIELRPLTNGNKNYALVV